MDKIIGDCRICIFNCIWLDYKNFFYFIEYEIVIEIRMFVEL